MTESPATASSRPLVSVIIPFYNREEFLGEAVESVLAQTFDDWELILVDDGSDDGSARIAREYSERHPSRIRLVGHDEGANRGATASRRLGFERAAGEFVTFLDSDDVFFKDTLERELRAFRENPEADAVCGTLVCWYSWSEAAAAGERDFTIDLVLDTERMYAPPELLIHNFRAGGRKPGMNCVMLKSGFARRIGVFTEDYAHAGEDQIFWLRVSLHGRIYVMDGVLAKYRQHPASTCAVVARDGRDLSSMNIYMDWAGNYLREQNVTDPEIWRAYRNFKRKCALEAKVGGVKRLYRRLLPLHVRYRLRDRITRAKRLLTRTAHRHE